MIWGVIKGRLERCWWVIKGRLWGGGCWWVIKGRLGSVDG